jgi:hypothetical protein
MPRYEYLTVDLNTAPTRGAATDLLNEFGQARWRLCWLTPNNVAYLERVIEEPPSERAPARKPRARTPAPAGG